MMESVLLIGYGLNRASDKNASWANVLTELRKIYSPQNKSDDEKGKDQEQPITYRHNPLEFERIDLAARSKNAADSSLDVRRQLASLIPSLKDLTLIKRFTSLDVKHILTRNYDYSLEVSRKPTFMDEKRIRSTTETKYSLFRYYDVPGKRIWHIHGELDLPNTICIGYAQYCIYLSKLSRYLTVPAKEEQPSHIHSTLNGTKRINVGPIILLLTMFILLDWVSHLLR